MSQVLSVAKELVKLSFSGDEKDPLTKLRLQKLLYYAQAWSLILRECELFSDPIEAGRQGPVIPTVYHGLPDGLGANQLDPALFEGAPDLQAEDAEFVRSVWEAYSPYSALQLSRMTREEMPWRKAWGNRPRDGAGNDPISVDDLEEFFGKQTIPAPLAAYCHDLRKREAAAERELAELPPLDVRRLSGGAASFTRAAHLLTDRG